MPVPRKTKEELWERCRGICEARLSRCTYQAMDPHHKKFRSRGGSDALINLAAVCRACHDMIHENTPEGARFRTRSYQREGENEEEQNA